LLPAPFSPVRGVKREQSHHLQDSRPVLVHAHDADEPSGLVVLGQEIIKLVEPPQNCRVYGLTFSPRGDSLVCAFALDQAVQVWDVTAKPRLITTLRPPAPNELLRDDAKGAPHPIAFSSDGARLAIGYYYQGFQIWDIAQCKPSPCGTTLRARNRRKAQSSTEWSNGRGSVPCGKS